MPSRESILPSYGKNISDNNFKIFNKHTILFVNKKSPIKPAYFVERFIGRNCFRVIFWIQPSLQYSILQEKFMISWCQLAK